MDSVSACARADCNTSASGTSASGPVNDVSDTVQEVVNQDGSVTYEEGVDRFTASEDAVSAQGALSEDAKVAYQEDQRLNEQQRAEQQNQQQTEQQNEENTQNGSNTGKNGTNTGDNQNSSTSSVPVGKGIITPSPDNWTDPTQPPGDGYVWRGQRDENGNPLNGKGSWYNPDTQESWHPDLEHGGAEGPHWDFSYKGMQDDGFERGWR
jgi:hypothetical protein